MKSRCRNECSPVYKYYGGRGIKFDPRWDGPGGFENFLSDMGKKPTKEHTLERMDRDGNYCKENCKWATRLEQANNTSRNHFIEFNGERLTITQWARKIGMSQPALHLRLKKMPVEIALTMKPVAYMARFKKPPETTQPVDD